MNLNEIKQAVEHGQTVCWSHTGYEVIKDKAGQLLIHCKRNNSYWGLTWQDGKTMNEKEDQFFIA